MYILCSLSETASSLKVRLVVHGMPHFSNEYNISHPTWTKIYWSKILTEQTSSPGFAHKACFTLRAIDNEYGDLARAWKLSLRIRCGSRGLELTTKNASSSSAQPNANICSTARRSTKNNTFVGFVALAACANRNAI